MSVIMGLRCNMVVIRQMRWGALQSVQTPVRAQGVSMPRLLARMGPATSRTRLRAESRSGVTLFVPATMNTFPGPKVMALVRFHTPSTFTTSPEAETALALQKKASHRPIFSRRSRSSSLESPSRQWS